MTSSAPSGRARAAKGLGRLVQFAILEPTRLATYSASKGDTVLWDNLSTPEVETRDERIAAAMLQGALYLQDRLGADMAQWRWGKLHTLTLASLVPPTRARAR